MIRRDYGRFGCPDPGRRGRPPARPLSKAALPRRPRHLASGVLAAHFQRPRRTAGAAALAPPSGCGRCTGPTAAAAIRAARRAWKTPRGGGCTRSSGYAALCISCSNSSTRRNSTPPAPSTSCARCSSAARDAAARSINRAEIADWRWISPEVLQSAKCRSDRQAEIYPLVHSGMGAGLARSSARGARSCGLMRQS